MISTPDAPGTPTWSYGDPFLQRVRSAAQSGDRSRFTVALRDGVRDWEDRSDRIVVASAMLNARFGKRPVPWVEEWTAAEPDNADAWALAGHVRMAQAWAIRGSGLAKRTPESRLRGFHQTLHDAEEACHRAAAIDDSDPTPWVTLLGMAKGQQIGLTATLVRWERLQERDPLHYRGALYAAESLSPMWGFHPSTVVQFAEQVTGYAPQGSPLHALTASAAIINALGDRQAERSWKQPDAPARIAVDAAAGRIRGLECTRPAAISAFNYLAFWYCRAHDDAEAWLYFQALGDRCSVWPWRHVSDLTRSARPQQVYNSASRKARRAAAQ